MHQAVIAPDLPAPTGLVRPLLEDEVDRHRSLHCAHYEDCLGEAVVRGWEGWSCAACPVASEQMREGQPELAELQVTAQWRPPRPRGPRPAPGGGSSWAVANALGDEALTVAEIAERSGMPLGPTRAALERLEAAAAVRKTRGRWKLTGKRRCTQCDKVKPREGFHAHRTGLLGLHSFCRACHNAARMRREREARRNA